MNKICLIIAAIFFAIGALAAILGAGKIAWLDAGFCLLTIAKIRGEW
jgi:hypothetical protein